LERYLAGTRAVYTRREEGHVYIGIGTLIVIIILVIILT
jgi:hypothetical protein